MGKLIWLASYPKSGNTWLRAFLHNYLRNRPEPHDINRLRDLTATENDLAHYQALDPQIHRRFTEQEVQRLRPHVHRALTETFPDHVFVKTHNALLVEAGVPLLTPAVTAAAIYIVRDPRDIALSYSHYLGVPVDQAIAFMASEGAATGGDDAHVFERLGSWSTHVASWTSRPNPRLLVLRYEDLFAAPEEGFGRVVSFLGGPPDPDRLRNAVTNSAFAELRRQEEEAGFVERPEHAGRFFRVGQPGQWCEALSPAQQRAMSARHAAQMQRHGYLV